MTIEEFQERTKKLIPPIEIFIELGLVYAEDFRSQLCFEKKIETIITNNIIEDFIYNYNAYKFRITNFIFFNTIMHDVF